MHWRPNIFVVPSGRTGEAFANELSRLFCVYATASPLESVAMKAVFLFPLLILQRSSRKAKTKEAVSHIERRLQPWSEGSFDEQLSEGNSIQARLSSSPTTSSNHNCLERSFGNHMMNGKVKSALHLISSPTAKHKPMLLDQLSDPQHPKLGSVREVLLSKHPPPSLIDPLAIHLDRSNPVQYPHSIVFDNITGDLIKNMALKCQGAAGPSGLDATIWRRLCCVPLPTYVIPLHLLLDVSVLPSLTRTICQPLLPVGSLP